MSRFIHDTPEHILQKQFEIIYAKSPQERMKMAFEMAALMRKMVENRVKRTYPTYSPTQIKIKVFEEMYQDDFTEEKMKQITKAMLNYEQGKESEPPQI